MKLKSGFVLEEVGGAYIAVAVGANASNALIKMNGTGAFLWRLLDAGNMTEDSLVQALTEEYEVDENLARRDVSAFVIKLREAGLLDE